MTLNKEYIAAYDAEYYGSKTPTVVAPESGLLAKTCGLSISDYIRRTALGQHPRQRLSEREIEALCSLADARGDLIRIAAAVKSIQADKRAMYFSDTRFVEQWMIAATQLINRWNQIENYLTE